jgi:hypothetical protein
VIDDFVGELNARLRVPNRDRTRILCEVREHLEDSVEHLRSSDPQSKSAVDEAIRAFGPATVIATQFNAAAGTRAMRRGTFVAFAAGSAVAAGFLVSAVTQPHPQTATGASFAVQASFFGAALAFQVALLAGVRAASRVLAIGRAAVADADDRLLVRRCATICIGALSVAAIGWATCVGLAARSLAHPNRATLVAGAAVMIGGVVVAIALLTKLGVNPLDEGTDARGARPGVVAFGERTVDLVQRHPVAACASLAALSGLTAMSHAETTAVGSIPWGALQAGAVVLGFVLLGPPLGLRERRTT